MKILKGTSDFGTIKSTLIQWEGSAPSQHCVNFAAFRREFESVTSVIFTLSEFHDEIQSVSSLKCMIEPDQEAMICRAKDYNGSCQRIENTQSYLLSRFSYDQFPHSRGQLAF